MSDHERAYKTACQLLLSGLIAAGRAARALNQIKNESDPQFVPEGFDLDIDDPFSPVCVMIRRAIALGYISESDDFLSHNEFDPAPNYRAVQV